MKSRVFMHRYWAMPVVGNYPPIFLDPAIYQESHIAGLAEICEHLIFYIELIDLGMTYDDETGNFERVQEVSVSG
jgi:hypothetical protein